MNNKISLNVWLSLHYKNVYADEMCESPHSRAVIGHVTEDVKVGTFSLYLLREPSNGVENAGP